jgi:type IV secretory pathway VirB2 component (pilin)
MGAEATLFKTMTTGLVILGLSVLYWFGEAFASANGPLGDIAAIWIIAPVIICHALMFGRQGLASYLRSAAAVGLLLSAICYLLSAILLARHFEIAHRGRYDRWHANRSYHLLFWSFVWFGVGSLLVSIRHRRYLRRIGPWDRNW